MNKTVLLAKANNVLVGAHPSLPDLQGFGRREMAIEPVRRDNMFCCAAFLQSPELRVDLVPRPRTNSHLVLYTKSAR